MSWTWTAGTDWAIGGVSIKAAAANAAPAITLPGAALGYTEGDGAAIIDAGATATDSDSTDLNGGTLTVDFTADSTANDRLAINNQGTGAGQIGVSGSNVTYEGTTIGTFTGGTDGSTPLVVTFNASSSPAAAQALMRNITYENVVGNPSTATRTVRFVLTDGDGGTSNTATESITVAAMNDAPVVGAPGAPLAAVEQVNLSIHGTGFTVSDVDEAGSGATATLNVNEGSITVVEGDSGVTITGGNGTGTVTLSGTIAQIDNLLTAGGTGTITYLNNTDAPSASAT